MEAKICHEQILACLPVSCPCGYSASHAVPHKHCRGLFLTQYRLPHSHSILGRHSTSRHHARPALPQRYTLGCSGPCKRASKWSRWHPLKQGGRCKAATFSPLTMCLRISPGHHPCLSRHALSCQKLQHDTCRNEALYCSQAQHLRGLNKRDVVGSHCVCKINKWEGVSLHVLSRTCPSQLLPHRPM